MEGYFKDRYAIKKFRRDSELRRDISWRPSLSFKKGKHLTVVVECSETYAYPPIMGRKKNEIMDAEELISAYAVCPSELLETPAGQEDVKALRSEGFGLITVDASGNAVEHLKPVPLIQVIGEGEFRTAARDLKGVTLTNVRHAFDQYQNNPPSGVMKVGEIVESLVHSAALVAKTQGIINASQASASVANVLKTMMELNYFSAIHQELSRARAFVGTYRNTAAHTPKTSKDEYVKYRDCRHGFLEGVHVVNSFRAAMTKVGLKIVSKSIM